jgi:serine/threonine-protein kinase RsbW/stage II sporulation protein AB (anti-sigma F factor)
MMHVGEPMELLLPAGASSVGVARRAVTELAQTCGADPHAVALCVSEAVGNAVVHGYRDGRTGVVRVLARMDADDTTFCVDVKDEGIGPAPRADSPGLGLGVPLIASLTKHLEIVPGEPGCRVTMWFDTVHSGARCCR